MDLHKGILCFPEKLGWSLWVPRDCFGSKAWMKTSGTSVLDPQMWNRPFLILSTLNVLWRIEDLGKVIFRLCTITKTLARLKYLWSRYLLFGYWCDHLKPYINHCTEFWFANYIEIMIRMLKNLFLNEQ